MIVFDVGGDVQYGDMVRLNGSFTTIDGLALRYTPLVKLNSNIYRTVTDTNGCFTYDVKAINLGTNNVVIFYMVTLDLLLQIILKNLK